MLKRYFVLTLLTAIPALVLSQTNFQVRFVSTPALYAQVGVEYVYLAKAVTADSAAVISYALEHHPDGMTINAVTGAVVWTPVAKGFFEIEIIAHSSAGGGAKQEFYLAVVGGNGIVQGKVTDTLAVGIPSALVEMWKVASSASMTFAYSARTSENGNYRIAHVDPGQYKIRASTPSGMYQSQWYDGVTEWAQATVVTVADSPSVTNIMFKLRGKSIVHPKVNVYGHVTDTLGAVIGGDGSRVVFVRAEFALNASGGLNLQNDNFRRFFDLNSHGDLRLEGNSEFVFKGKVDSTGMYHVQLPPGPYIAFAKSNGYATEFYLEQNNLLSATVLRLQNDTSEINFTLAPLPPVVLGTISGSVLDTARSLGVPARVIAFRDRWKMMDQYHVARVYVTDADSTGKYQFADLLPGSYFVLAVPLGYYAPSFYSNDTNSTRWRKASPVVVNGDNVQGIDIYVRPLKPDAGGYAGITGRVAVSGAGMGMGTNTAATAGALVCASRNGQVAGYAFTDISGNYSIDGIGAGSYTVSVDKPGYNEPTAQTSNVGYDLSGNPQNGTVNFSMENATGVTGSTPVQPTEYSLGQNYPNPFNPTTRFSYSLPSAGPVRLTVYNVIGQAVAQLVNGYQNAGQYTVSFDGTSLATGVYFYQLEAGSSNIVRRMILLK